ncbi:KpsF/GutQ family sugar-phosphate isomerase [Zavarzinella formosa]|uniref:KpsF/GutQ family sugar-phosphate isomerase n=1 Tax=Zavarzinella formosa TaxID=360055 RepID=UPI00030BCF48|nr:KpsF/GutQ family sugar-phosphate isomerase [Zavarzinella formosa]
MTLSSETENISEITPLDRARQVLRDEAEALLEVADRLGESFNQATEILWRCCQADGRVGVTGVGKSADVAQKIVGTLNSTGTRAYLLDATRALHGDLGMIHSNDVMIVLSNSGESEEIVRLLKPLREMGDSVIAITGNKAGTLALSADAAIIYGPIVESSPFGLAPSTSATVAMAIGHSLAFALCDQREFTDDEFARYHPAGSLGFKLSLVEKHMRRGGDLRLARATASVREVFSQASHTGRRTGAVMLVDEDGKLVGLFTDSDLAKLFERRADTCFDEPIDGVMTKMPLTISPRRKMQDAIQLMKDRKISELPVIDAGGRPVGLLDITDIIGAEADPKDVSSDSQVPSWNKPAA